VPVQKKAAFVTAFVVGIELLISEAARTAHGAVVARFTTRFDAAGFLLLEVIHEFRYDCFLHAKLLQAGMGKACVDAGQPG
jgi:hypothetical protein